MPKHWPRRHQWGGGVLAKNFPSHRTPYADDWKCPQQARNYVNWLIRSVWYIWWANISNVKNPFLFYFQVSDFLNSYGYFLLIFILWRNSRPWPDKNIQPSFEIIHFWTIHCTIRMKVSIYQSILQLFKKVAKNPFLQFVLFTFGSTSGQPSIGN